MRVGVIGATGFVGSHITNELAIRNIEVIAICRTRKISDKKNVKYVMTDVRDVKALTEVLRVCNAVVSAFNPGWGNPNIYEDFIVGSKAIQKAVKLAGVKRFIVIGGSGSLYVAEGLQAVDTDDFPLNIKSGSLAARDYLDILKEEKELNWAFFSPPFEMHSGITGRTRKYRLGSDYPINNKEGRSFLSGEDLAVVIADEIKNPKHHQVRFTAAY